MKNKKAGAPKGGRVHWLLWNLPGEFKGAYELYYDYAKHNYIFLRHEGRKLYDVFIVIQTSRHYWRIMYANAATNEYQHFGDKKTARLARRMWYIFKIDQQNREKLRP